MSWRTASNQTSPAVVQVEGNVRSHKESFPHFGLSYCELRGKPVENLLSLICRA